MQGSWKATIMALAMASAGCSSETTQPPTTVPETDALTLSTSEVTLEAGEERYLCWSVKVPDDGVFQLEGIDFEVPEDIHHYQLQVQAGAEAGPYDCGLADGGMMGGPQGGLPTILAVGGPGTAPTLRYPAGTAIPLEAGSYVVMQLHILNAAQAARTFGAARAHLRRAAGDDLAQVGVLLVNDGSLVIPPMTTGVEAGYDCTIAEPIERVFSVWPHMHMLGKHIEVTIAGERVVDMAWNFEQQLLYEVDRSVTAGEMIGVHCVYDNPTQNEVTFGMSTNDEMCTAFVYYYPAIPGFGFCEGGA